MNNLLRIFCIIISVILFLFIYKRYNNQNIDCIILGINLLNIGGSFIAYLFDKVNNSNNFTYKGFILNELKIVYSKILEIILILISLTSIVYFYNYDFIKLFLYSIMVILIKLNISIIGIIIKFSNHKMLYVVLCILMGFMYQIYFILKFENLLTLLFWIYIITILFIMVFFKTIKLNYKI